MSLKFLALGLLATTSLAAPGKRQATTTTAANTNPTTTLLATATAKSYGLNDAAKAAGKLFFGTAADIPGTGEATDKFYLKEFNNKHDFGEATPANIMKFVYTEPEQNVFNFTGGDYFLDLAEQSGKLVRCHNLIWSSQLPSWVTDPATPWTKQTLSKVLRNHVKKVVSHFGDRYVEPCVASDIHQSFVRQRLTQDFCSVGATAGTSSTRPSATARPARTAAMSGTTPSAPSTWTWRSGLQPRSSGSRD